MKLTKSEKEQLKVMELLDPSHGRITFEMIEKAIEYCKVQYPKEIDRQIKDSLF